MIKKIIHTDKAPKNLGPYSQAVEVEGILYVSGQIPINPESEELVGSDIKLQTNQVLQNIEAILKEADYTLEDVVKVEVFIDNMDNFPEVNEVYANYFINNPPARVCVEVACLPKNASVEISVIAVNK